MIKIGYNYQIFTEQKYGGVSRIFSEIAPLINKSDEFSVKVYAGLHQNKYLANDSNIIVKGRQINYPARGIRLFSYLNPVFAKAVLEIEKPDIVHETYYSRINTVPSKSKVVITVLDMIHEIFVGSMESSKYLEVKANAIRRADSIICISNNTKEDLIKILDIDPDKISVVHLGCTINSGNFIKTTPIISQPYILYVGMREPLYKNFERLLRAYQSNKNLNDNFKLVCFGSKPFSQKELAFMQDIGINQSNLLYYSGDDSTLANFYTHAAAFIYPSLYEGFGIPPLEAMSFNCPVVCSNTSSIPEVVGNAGEYFDPGDTNSISQAIEKVVFSVDLKQDMIRKGKMRTELFSWDKCAEETKSVYREIISTR